MPLLEVRNLTTRFHTRNGVVRAVEDVSFDVEAGKTLGIVGESGSGKSVTCYSLLGLVPQPPGRITGCVVVDCRRRLDHALRVAFRRSLRVDVVGVSRSHR